MLSPPNFLPTFSQDPPKLAPRRPNLPPRSLHLGIKTPKVGFKSPPIWQERPQRAQEPTGPSKAPQNLPRIPPKSAPECPKTPKVMKNGKSVEPKMLPQHLFAWAVRTCFYSSCLHGLPSGASRFRLAVTDFLKAWMIQKVFLNIAALKHSKSCDVGRICLFVDR